MSGVSNLHHARYRSKHQGKQKKKNEVCFFFYPYRVAHLTQGSTEKVKHSFDWLTNPQNTPWHSHTGSHTLIRIYAHQ